jgi:cytochrome c5
MNRSTAVRASRGWLAARPELIAAAVATVMMMGAPGVTGAQPADRSGEVVVNAACVVCHGSGKDGAPMIGDAKAWSARASLGLSALTQHAIQGIRQMPAHGGSAAVSDLEIARAITYMVNRSGGHWAEPIDTSKAPAGRTGEQVVQSQCGNCHRTGENGAPRIGDRAAWTPRLAHGIDAAVRSAIHGHGGMPARGGLADLTDVEIRNAVLYMFNPAGAAVAAKSRPAPVSGGNRKVVAGLEIDLGVVAAESLRGRPGIDQKMHAGNPGKGHVHLNVSIFDNATRAAITDAAVEATVKDPMMGSQTRKLDVMVVNGVQSYGNYFRRPGANPYKIAVQVRRPGAAPVEAEFDFKR